ncbi:unnamed protein product [Effrenium voratum]|uniref:Uncharacterized protein n=1 Tax=Effrenium voratum TaxID=2562239 RepID=A0AA36MXX6_9DINO|nr:unnamed protein product [Effrenium voratum]
MGCAGSSPDFHQGTFSASLQVVAFAASLASFLLPRIATLGCVAVVVYILGSLKCSLGVLLLSVLVGKIHQNHHERAVIYYSWTLDIQPFPCWKLVLSMAACVLGGFCGHHLWENYWQQYQEVSLLKAYRGIDPGVVPGRQIQDAGAVDFARSAGVDTEHAGCFMHAGRTYCVAPIVTNGTIQHDIGNAPRYGSYDYFAVGVDCCSCPDLDFRCGPVAHPWAEGGIRSTDLEARPFFRLAVEAWASSFRKTASHPLFFEWVESPVKHWPLRSIWCPRVFFRLGLCTRFRPSEAIRVFSSLQALVAHQLASPLQVPGPPEGFGDAWRRFLPEMLASYKELGPGGLGFWGADPAFWAVLRGGTPKGKGVFLCCRNKCFSPSANRF